jgi:hypothetical protein
MSITVAGAKTYRCLPGTSNTSHFPTPASGSFEILATPIGGAEFPVENGDLGVDLRFVKRVGTVIDVGPSLLEYGDYSGGARPSFDEVGKTLWIFDDQTERGSEVIRISTTTGAILQRTAMPVISRPIIGVNALGFWLGQDSDSGFTSGQVRLGVWFAPIRASRSELVKATQGSIWAMRPEGDAMDVFLSPNWPSNKLTYQLWRFSPGD